MHTIASNLTKNEIASCKSWARKNRFEAFANSIRVKIGAHSRLCINHLLDTYAEFIGYAQVQHTFQLAFPMNIEKNDSLAHLDEVIIDIESFFSKDMVSVLGQYIQWCQRHHLSPTNWDQKLVQHIHRESTDKIANTYLAFYHALHIWTNTPWTHETSIDEILKLKFPYETTKTWTTLIGNLRLEQVEHIAPKFINNLLARKQNIPSYVIEIEAQKEFIRDSICVLLTTPLNILETYGYTDEILQNIYSVHLEDINYSSELWDLYRKQKEDQSQAILNYHWFSQLCLYSAFLNRPAYLKDNDEFNTFEKRLEENISKNYAKQWHIWQIYQSVGMEKAYLKTFSAITTKMDSLELDPQILIHSNT